MKYIVVLVVLLAGCAGTQEKRIATWQSRCSSYGLTLGTTEFAQCMMFQQQQFNASSDQMMGTGVMLMNQQPSRPATVCNQIGTTFVCN